MTGWVGPINYVLSHNRSENFSLLHSPNTAAGTALANHVTALRGKGIHIRLINGKGAEYEAIMVGR